MYFSVCSDSLHFRHSHKLMPHGRVHVFSVNFTSIIILILMTLILIFANFAFTVRTAQSCYLLTVS